VTTYARGGPEREALVKAGFVFSIHNLAYQGPLNLEAGALADPWGGLEANVERTLLARGILSADVVNTVSDSYLEEILTPEHGMSMDSVLRSRQGDLYDVLNGVDFEEFDPRTDPYIVANYDGRSFPQGKKNKAALQRSSSLAVDPDVPLFGMGPGWSRERCRRALRGLRGSFAN